MLRLACCKCLIGLINFWTKLFVASHQPCWLRGQSSISLPFVCSHITHMEHIALEGWHDLSISEFPFHPPYFHLICRFHPIYLFSFSLLASCRAHLPHPPASGRHFEFWAVRICHLVHLVHLIYANRAHLGRGRASQPSHLPHCHLELEIGIWVFTTFPGRASPQVAQRKWHLLNTTSALIEPIQQAYHNMLGPGCARAF